MGETIDIKALINSGLSALENYEFKKAEQCFDLALSFDSNCFDAYLGKTLCHYGLVSIEELKLVANENLLKYFLFIRLKELASGDNIHIISELEECVSNNAKRTIYNNAKKDMETGFFEGAYNKFEKLGDYLDAQELCRYSKYSRACLLFENIDDQCKCSYVDIIIKLFNEVIDYKDSKEKIATLLELKEKLQNSVNHNIIERFKFSIPKDTSLKSIGIASQNYKANALQFEKLFEVNETTKELLDNGQKSLYEYLCSAIDSRLVVNKYRDIDYLNTLIFPLIILKNDPIKEYVDKVKNQLSILSQRRKKKMAIIVPSIIGGLAVIVSVTVLSSVVIGKSLDYKKAYSLMQSQEYDKAIDMFTNLGSFKDSKRKIEVCEGLKIIDKSKTSSASAAMQGVKKIILAGEKAIITFSSGEGYNISQDSERRSSVTITFDSMTTFNSDGYNVYHPDLGYRFLYWYMLDYSYSNNTTYINYDSCWKAVIYSISYFNINNSSHSNPTSYTIESDTIVLEPAVKDGYSFDGWTVKKGYDYLPISEIPHGSTGDLNIYANWSKL